jgi:hypothetical protein
MAYQQRPVPRSRSMVPPGIAMRRPTYLRFAGRHLNGVLGQNPLPTIATSAPSIAGSVGASAAGIAAGSALGIAIPVVGVVLGALIGSLFAAHAKRVAGAKQENQVLNSLIPTVQSAVQGVFSALNAGTATPAQGIAALQSIWQQYWQAVQQVEGGPGQAGSEAKCITKAGAGLHITGTASVQNPPGSNFSGYGPVAFDKSCTASCGVGCMWVASWVNVGIALINAGKGTVTFDGVVGNTYGLQNYPSLTVTYTPPSASSTASSAGAAVAGVASDVASVAGDTIFGIPIWGIAVAAIIGIWAMNR